MARSVARPLLRCSTGLSVLEEHLHNPLTDRVQHNLKEKKKISNTMCARNIKRSMSQKSATFPPRPTSCTLRRSSLVRNPFPSLSRWWKRRKRRWIWVALKPVADFRDFISSVKDFSHSVSSEKQMCPLFRQLCSYPTTNGGVQNGSPVGIRTHCMHVFARLPPICKLSGCLLTKNLCNGAQSEV